MIRLLYILELLWCGFFPQMFCYLNSILVQLSHVPPKYKQIIKKKLWYAYIHTLCRRMFYEQSTQSIWPDTGKGASIGSPSIPSENAHFQGLGCHRFKIVICSFKTLKTFTYIFYFLNFSVQKNARLFYPPKINEKRKRFLLKKGSHFFKIFSNSA